MTSDPRLERLLEEIVASGRSPEEVCRACPELIPRVVEGLRRVRALEAELEAVFPTTGPKPGASGIGEVLTGAGLPSVPGYSVISVLGRGGMGVVYKARHLKLDRMVAIKMLLSGGFAAAAELARFLREARAIAALRHPNIVHVYDVGDLDGRPYFTMEYVEGGNLAQRLAGVPQPASEAAAMVATLADAVQVAHTEGIVHRDLKPANILLTSDGTPKVTDFGLARRYEEGPDLTVGGTRLGTPSYMSPEQALGREGAVGPSADIYSLGAVLYEMLTGRPPFRAETPAETERQVIAEEAAPPSRLNARIPRDLETVCIKCLSKEPQRRYPSASALAEDLRRFLRGEPIAARRAGPCERGAKWVRRKPAYAGMMVLSALLVLGSLGVGAWALAHAAETARAVTGDMLECERLEAAELWTEARTVLERAKARLGGDGTAALRARVSDAERGLTLVAGIDMTRRKQLISGAEGLNRVAICVAADRAYDSLFRQAGLIEGEHDASAAVGLRVRKAAIHRVLVEALDDWSQCIIDEHGYDRRCWLMEVAREADPDPSGWRDRARQPEAWYDLARLSELAETMPAGERALALPLALGERLGAMGGDCTGLLRRIQAAHPGDFWANYALGWRLLRQSPGQALGYFRAAVAARPDAVEARANLGLALGMLGEAAEAEVHLRESCRLDPAQVTALANLGFLLHLAGRDREAVEVLSRVSALRPHDANDHVNLAEALEATGRFEEAAEEFRTAVQIAPGTEEAVVGLSRCESLHALEPRLDSAVGGEDGLRSPAERALFGTLCRLKGRNAEAVRIYCEAFDADSALADNISCRFRHQAACAAALAGCGVGAPTPETATDQRARYREQARRWLLEETSRLRSGINDPSARGLIRDTVVRWMVDPALSGIRDVGSLNLLAEDERARCLEAWARMRQLQRELND